MAKKDKDDAREILFVYGSNPEGEAEKDLYKSIAEETYEMYEAFMNAGFTGQQAFELVLSMLVTSDA